MSFLGGNAKNKDAGLVAAFAVATVAVLTPVWLFFASIATLAAWNLGLHGITSLPTINIVTAFGLTLLVGRLRSIFGSIATNAATQAAAKIPK